MSSLFFTTFFGIAQRRFWLQAIVLLGLASPFFLLWTQFKDQIAKQPEYAVTPQSIHVLDPPTWFSKRIIHEALNLLPQEYQNKPLAAFDASLVDALRDAFKAHPMILDVKSIVCQYPAVVKVRLVFRDPVAVVDASPEDAAAMIDEFKLRFPKV